MCKRNSKGRVVGTWMERGIYDLFVSFDIDEKHTFLSVFFLHQGLEKLCKAYLLCKRSKEYEILHENEGLIKINEIVKDRKTMGHSLAEMLKKVFSNEEHEIIFKEYRNSKMKIVDIVENGYLECRYPVPNPTYKKFPIEGENNMYTQPMGDSDLPIHIFRVSNMLINKIEKDFNVDINITLEKRSSKIKNDEWERFTNLLRKH